MHIVDAYFDVRGNYYRCQYFVTVINYSNISKVMMCEQSQ